MASITAPRASYSHLLNTKSCNLLQEDLLATRRASSRTRSRTSRLCIVFASQGPQTRRQWKRPPPGVDTRIHWDNPDEGWIGGSTEQKKSLEDEQKNFMGDKFGDLINNSSDSHYQFLGVSAEADIEEIKAAYRRLTKEFHPDTTTLPLKSALQNFMRLKEVYEVLTDEEKRRFYDWSLAQEAASREAEKLRKKLEDPFEQDFQNYKSVPDMVDRLGGRNMELGDQATAALTIDIFIIIFCICSIIFVVFFKEQ